MLLTNSGGRLEVFSHLPFTSRNGGQHAGWLHDNRLLDCLQIKIQPMDLSKKLDSVEGAYSEHALLSPQSLFKYLIFSHLGSTLQALKLQLENC